MENHYQSVIKNSLIIQTLTKSSEIVLKIEIKIAMLLMVLILQEIIMLMASV